jgi:hypothetical protein
MLTLSRFCFFKLAKFAFHGEWIVDALAIDRWPSICEHGNDGHTVPTQFVGAIYLSHSCSRHIRAKGNGKAALAELRRLHPGRVLANIAPGNERSQRFFAAQGFRHIQYLRWMLGVNRRAREPAGRAGRSCTGGWSTFRTTRSSCSTRCAGSYAVTAR